MRDLLHSLTIAVVLAIASASCVPSATGVDTCVSTADCAAGHVCVNGRCRKACNTRSDCAAGEACIEGICLTSSSSSDAAQSDAAAPDAGAGLDRGGHDVSNGDRGSLDASTGPDLAMPDTGAIDTGATDTGVTDTGIADAGVVDAARADLLSTDHACQPSCAGRCAGADDDCGGTCPSDACDSTCCATVCCADQQVCDAEDGSCCSPQTCQQLGVGCGAATDSCGMVHDCGLCGGGGYCLQGSCRALTMSFVEIQGGSFDMGTPPGEPGRDAYDGYPVGTLDERLHNVQLTRRFELSDAEATTGDFFTMMGYRPSYYEWCGDSCAVEWVTWSEAAAFCNQLSIGRGLSTCFDCSGAGADVRCAIASEFLADPQSCPGYRLPTEAEWEYGARAGTSGAFWSGPINEANCAPLDAALDPVAWYLGNAEVIYTGFDATCDGADVNIGTHAVRQKTVNPWELYDVHGNVWEWVLDCIHSYPSGAQIDPVGPLICEHNERIFRGGGIGSPPPFCRSGERANHGGGDSGSRGMDIGFRPARTLVF